MRENNDCEMAEFARKVQMLGGRVDKVMRDGSLNDVIDLAADMENAARHWGWVALHLKYHGVKK